MEDDDDDAEWRRIKSLKATRDVVMNRPPPNQSRVDDDVQNPAGVGFLEGKGISGKIIFSILCVVFISMV